MKKLYTFKLFKESINIDNDFIENYNKHKQFKDYYQKDVGFYIYNDIKRLLDKYRIKYITDGYDVETGSTSFILNFKNIKIDIGIYGGHRDISVYITLDMGKNTLYKTTKVESIKQLEDKLLNLVKSDVTRALFKMNENLTEESISKDPNTTPEEKENLRIKMNIEYYNQYKSKKMMFDKMFDDIEEEIDVTTLNKLIGDNPFIKQYTQLLYKKRNLLIAEEQINKKKEKIKELNDEIGELNLNKNRPSDTTTPDTLNSNINEDISNNEDKLSISDQITLKYKEISELNKEITEIQRKLSQSNIKEILNKWNTQMSKTIRDLKMGKPLLISNLSHFK